MIKRMASLSIMALLVQGCGSSDTEVDYVSSESTFSCGEFNRIKAIGTTNDVTAIVNTAYSQLDREYIEDTAIQRFYRNQIRTDIDYAVRYVRTFTEACNGKPDIGVNRAATDALNTMYEQVQVEPRWASCHSFNQGTINADDVYQEMQQPTTLMIGGDPVVGPVFAVANSSDYGTEYLDKKVREACVNEPDKLLWSTYSSISYPIYQELQRQALEDQNAERQRRKEEERQENLEKFSDSLYSNGIATCESLRDLLYHTSLGDDKEHYLNALTATLKDIPEMETSHHRTAFEEALQGDIQQFGLDIERSCSNDDFVAAVMRTRQVSSAKSDYRITLEEMYERNSYSSSCYKNRSEVFGMCAGRDLAQQAYDQGLACESGSSPEGLLCFENPNYIYEYLFLEMIKQNFLKQQEEITQRLNAPIGYSQLDFFMQPCRERLIERGLIGSDYHSEVDRICPSEGTEAYKEQFLLELQEIGNELSEIQAQLDEIMASANNK